LRTATSGEHGRRAGLRAGANQVQSLAKMKTESQRVVKAMSPAQKLKAAERLYHSARQLKAAALRAQHPEWTDEAIRQAVREVFLHARG
jgi:Rv0078B-related antitoxin